MIISRLKDGKELSVSNKKWGLEKSADFYLLNHCA